jgi:hypothetical protein
LLHSLLFIVVVRDYLLNARKLYSSRSYILCGSKLVHELENGERKKNKITIYTHGSVKKRQTKHVSVDVKVCVKLTVLDITVNLEKVLNFHIQNKSSYKSQKHRHHGHRHDKFS